MCSKMFYCVVIQNLWCSKRWFHTPRVNYVTCVSPRGITWRTLGNTAVWRLWTHSPRGRQPVGRVGEKEMHIGAYIRALCITTCLAASFTLAKMQSVIASQYTIIVIMWSIMAQYIAAHLLDVTTPASRQHWEHTRRYHVLCAGGCTPCSVGKSRTTIHAGILNVCEPTNINFRNMTLISETWYLCLYWKPKRYFQATISLSPPSRYTWGYILTTNNSTVSFCPSPSCRSPTLPPSRTQGNILSFLSRIHWQRTRQI